jgi:hypothetical protein
LSDNQKMSSPSRVLGTLLLAGYKRGRAVLRQLARVEFEDWQARAEICQRCPLVVVRCGKSYCGNPLMEEIDRDQPTKGCGCPVVLKAKDPQEHCPRDLHFNEPDRSGECTCHWCVQLRGRSGGLRAAS